MSLAEIETLRLDPDRVDKAVRFHAAWATTCERELEAPPSGADQDEARWVARADAASALTEAAQWATLIEPGRAVELGARAARHFVTLGHAYGLYLTGVCSPLAMPSELVGRLVARVFAGTERDGDDGDPAGRFLGPLGHPQQQAYLALAAVATPAIDPGARTALGNAMSESQHARSGAPVGAMGVALRHYWFVASSLLRREDPERMLDHLSVLARTHAEILESAMSNHHLWRHCASPVVVADLDIVGMTALARRTLGREFTDRLYQRVDTLPPLARVALRLGIELDGAGMAV